LSMTQVEICNLAEDPKQSCVNVMCFRSRVSGLFTLTMLASCLFSLSSLASDMGQVSHPSSSSLKLLGRTNGVPVTHHLKTLRKATKHKLRSIHHRNNQYHKKAKTKSCARRHDDDAKTKKPKQLKAEQSHAKPKSNQAKEKYLLAPTQAISSILHATSACGGAQPTRTITKTSGPNGHELFLNCGINDGGWKPPHVTMSMVTRLSLDQEPAKSTFAPCRKYRPLFEKYGKAFGIPPIFLAAFAMQESSCRPDVVGDQGGAFGLMQITKDKCGEAPGGNCSEPDYNIKMGAKTFATGLTEANGNVLLALGRYNGVLGTRAHKAKSARGKGQRLLCVSTKPSTRMKQDYLHEFLNAWILGVDPHSCRLGIFRNLDVCGDS
ncbi:uncharacterized protein VP01_2854g2, partial [Puccinia sorghi]